LAELIILSPFNIRTDLFVAPSETALLKYANETDIVNKDSPIC